MSLEELLFLLLKDVAADRSYGSFGIFYYCQLFLHTATNENDWALGNKPKHRFLAKAVAAFSSERRDNLLLKKYWLAVIPLIIDMIQLSGFKIHVILLLYVRAHTYKNLTKKFNFISPAILFLKGLPPLYHAELASVSAAMACWMLAALFLQKPLNEIQGDTGFGEPS